MNAGQIACYPSYCFRFLYVLCIVGGACLVIITAFTAYSSAVYNIAIARSNTQIVVNSVIILFIIDIDEQFYRVIFTVTPKWLEKLKEEQACNLRHEEARFERARSAFISPGMIEPRRSVYIRPNQQGKQRGEQGFDSNHSDEEQIDSRSSIGDRTQKTITEYFGYSA
jgi:hypothetical protein